MLNLTFMCLLRYRYFSHSAFYYWTYYLLYRYFFVYVIINRLEHYEMLMSFILIYGISSSSSLIWVLLTIMFIIGPLEFFLHVHFEYCILVWKGYPLSTTALLLNLIYLISSLNRSFGIRIGNLSSLRFISSHILLLILLPLFCFCIFS